MTDSKSATQRLLTVMDEAVDASTRKLPPIEDFNTIEFYFHLLFQQNTALMKSVAKLEEVVIVGNGTPSLRERMNAVERAATEAAEMRKAIAAAEDERKREFRNHLAAIWTAVIIGIISWLGPYLLHGVKRAVTEQPPQEQRAPGSPQPGPVTNATTGP